MADDKMFRNALNGFNKEDVIAPEIKRWTFIIFT